MSATDVLIGLAGVSKTRFYCLGPKGVLLEQRRFHCYTDNKLSPRKMMLKKSN